MPPNQLSNFVMDQWLVDDAGPTNIQGISPISSPS